MKRVLITGITGQVGSQLADYILNNTDYEVVGMMRWQEPLDNIYHLTDRINKKDRISIYYADLNDGMSIRRMIEEIRPDYISHLAAQSYPKTSFDIPIETLQTNIIGTANLLEAIRHWLALVLRLIHTNYLSLKNSSAPQRWSRSCHWPSSRLAKACKR